MLLLERVTESEAETEALGRALGSRLGPGLGAGSTWLLSGEMGAGKTVLARGLCRGLGVEGRVRSPSFTLVTSYRGRLPVVHVDLYRLESPEAIEGLGWDELRPADAILIVEWGERARPLVGEDRFEAELSCLDQDRRLIRLAALGAEGMAIGRELRVTPC
jgi:tRNA threonylcarbamoyladenosine biosynthesis protein TsaE